MEHVRLSICVLISILRIFTRDASIVTASENLFTKSELKTYIVHVQPPKNAVLSSAIDRESWYRSFLPVTEASSSEPRMVHAYHEVFSGFAARLTQGELESMSKKDGFLQSYPDHRYTLKTTHTPKFLGLNLGNGLWKESNMGRGVIVGVLDGGVFPSHPSFSGDGMPPPPPKWKGRCEFNTSLCNNKLIGARAFFSGAAASEGISVASLTPDDDDGHGSHTASTAAGGFVPDADVLGNAKGTASGIAPCAHLAIYKVCGFGGPVDCASSDILAGMDAAMSDGVDVLSLSLGMDSVPFNEDPVAIAGFQATAKGIFVSCAAGNSGPAASSLSNEAPWLLTVGASTIDRRIEAAVKLGNGLQFYGESVLPYQTSQPTLSPLVYAGASKNPAAVFCGNGSLDPSDVTGKVVLCERGGGIARIDKGETVKRAGGVAMILMNSEKEGYSTLADAHSLPASHVSFSDGLQIKEYINSTTKPMATILFEGTKLGISPTPTVASFSSRGPSLTSPGILKPDIIGPGVSILAAWPFPPTLNSSSKANAFYNIMSGTSMSTPHLSGIAALLKSVHPDWSPAAIKSAIMTTANDLDWNGEPILDERNLTADVFAIGAGHVNAMSAGDPGLVYDLAADDYIPYLCGLGYSNNQVQIITGRAIDCSTVESIADNELNYPSMSVALSPKIDLVNLTRTVKNVGEAYSTYWVEVDAPKGVLIDVEPKVLRFFRVNQEIKFTVSFKSNGAGAGRGYLKWVSKKQKVRSPISFTYGI